MMKEALSPSQPIGIFDSGVGGFSVFRAVRDELPYEDLFYLGDQWHVPYGPRPKAEIRDFAVEITRFLLDHGAKMIIVACNTASAAALYELRDIFPSVLIVGMEPAIKPAAAMTQTGKVGVLATPTTFRGDLYESVVKRFGQGVQIMQSTCPGLVEQIEAGHINSPETGLILKEALEPMLEKGIDAVVMGCTHYPFVIPLIREIVGPQVQIIDPAPAIARHVRNLLNQHGLLNTNNEMGAMRFYTSGEPDALSRSLKKLLGQSASVVKVNWQGGTLCEGSCC